MTPRTEEVLAAPPSLRRYACALEGALMRSAGHLRVGWSRGSPLRCSPRASHKYTARQWLNNRALAEVSAYAASGGEGGHAMPCQDPARTP